jgi:hypothetical protein
MPSPSNETLLIVDAISRAMFDPSKLNNTLLVYNPYDSILDTTVLRRLTKIKYTEGDRCDKLRA